MENEQQKHKQVLWIFGVFERLAHLGYIQNPPAFIPPERIDYFLEIDEDRYKLFDSEDQFEKLVEYVCRDCGITRMEEISTVTQLTRDYRDHREALVQFALMSIF